jgi:hypothetical protein
MMYDYNRPAGLAFPSKKRFYHIQGVLLASSELCCFTERTAIENVPHQRIDVDRVVEAENQLEALSKIEWEDPNRLTTKWVYCLIREVANERAN